MNLRIFDTPDALARGAAEAMVRRVEHNGARIIALSGGSTPAPVYAHLANGDLRDRLAEFDVTWVVGDERYVAAVSPDSNRRMIEETLFAAGVPPGHQLLAFDTEATTPEEAADKFEIEWLERGIKALDLAILGVGEDGHTASLFPGTSALDQDERIASAVFVPKLDAWRLTLTIPTLRAAAARFILAAGAKKNGVIEAVKGGEELPVAIVTRDTLDSWWFIDRAAAEGLPR